MKMPSVRTAAWCAVVGCAVAILARPVGAWNETGHQVVATVALRHLEPAVKLRVMALLEKNPQFDMWMESVWSGATPDERLMTAMNGASIWPDFIKNQHGYVSDGDHSGNVPPPGPAASQNVGYVDMNRHKYWHFVDVPFSDDGTPTEPVASVTAATQIVLLRDALRGGVSDDIKSYDLVWLIHLVGDVHQPLHAITRYTTADPNGDTGGNDVFLQCGELDCFDRLHLQWDHAAGDAVSRRSILAAVKAADAGAVPAGSEAVDVSEWVRESFEMAKRHAYRTSTGKRLGSPSATIDQAYMERAARDGRRRLRLAGLRLAKLLNDALSQ